VAANAVVSTPRRPLGFARLEWESPLPGCGSAPTIDATGRAATVENANPVGQQPIGGETAMMRVLFRIPGLNVSFYSFGVMLALGVVAGVVLARQRFRREGLDPDRVYDLAIVTILAGLVGARLFYVAQYWGETVNSWTDALRIWEGGIVLYGGAFGALAGFLLYRAFVRFPTLATLDAMAPSLALGLAIGRLGCWLNGCCYGQVCAIPGLGASFPPDSPPWRAEVLQRLIPKDAPTSWPLHPTQIYSALDAVMILLVLLAYYPLRRRDGEVFGLLLLIYPPTRFLIELLRDDEAAMISGFTVAQVVSLIVFGLGLSFWSHIGRTATRREAVEV
jgi:phosphatidylglycerol---prolipoprotein diacylglyceryl transferase